MPDTGSVESININGFMKVPNQLWATGLKATTMMVYLAYLKHADNKTQECYPSQGMIGALCGLAKISAVKTHTDILIKEGLLEVVSEKVGQAKRYRVLLPVTEGSVNVTIVRGRGGLTSPLKGGTPEAGGDGTDGVDHPPFGEPTTPLLGNQPPPVRGGRTRPIEQDPINYQSQLASEGEDEELSTLTVIGTRDFNPPVVNVQKIAGETEDVSELSRLHWRELTGEQRTTLQDGKYRFSGSSERWTQCVPFEEVGRSEPPKIPVWVGWDMWRDAILDGLSDVEFGKCAATTEANVRGPGKRRYLEVCVANAVRDSRSRPKPVLNNWDEI